LILISTNLFTALILTPTGLSSDNVVIKDCLSLNSDQIYAAMYGAIQKLISVIEVLENKVTQLENLNT